MNAKQKFIQCGYGEYFTLNINQRINARQRRNSLNINHLFATVLRQTGGYFNYETSYPKINNGLYHHAGKSHSKYPKNDAN
jgi:hypothetical protein